MSEPNNCERVCGSCIWFDIVEERTAEDCSPELVYGCRNDDSPFYGYETGDNDTCEHFDGGAE